MKKKSGIFIILTIITFIFLPLVSAQQPPAFPSVQFTEGFAIDFSEIGVYPFGNDLIFNAHVFNISNGVRIDNSSTDCNYHLFDNTGTIILNQEPMTFDVMGLDYEITVDKNNFTRLGEYSYLIVCNDSTNNLGGLVSVGFKVTPTGIELDTGKALVYLILLIGSLLIFSLTLWGSIVLPIKNKRNGLDEVIDVDFLKYAKVSLMFISYTILVWIINLLIALSNGFILLNQYSGFFTMTFEILVNILAFPLFILMIIIFFLMGANDLKLKKFLERGINVR